MQQYNAIGKEDYAEPVCPFCKPDQIETIPVDRVIEKLDAYLHKNDYASAERHLRYWLSEAKAHGDNRGALTILNEQIGLYRKISREQEAMQACAEALQTVKACNLDGSVTMGTTLVNAATAYKAFGKASDAIPLYNQAQAIYEQNLSENDARLGGLYNNAALSYMECGGFDEAQALFDKALEVMTANGSLLEMAITHCNLADLVNARVGTEAGEAEIAAQLERAESLLFDSAVVQNGYAAFVYEKCAPTFGYYGYFLTRQELEKRARELYERS